MAPEGGAAPEVSVIDPRSGTRLSAEELKGKVLFVNFWATWCQPCKDELPSVEALYREMAGTEGFRMITILYNDSPEAAFGHLKSKGYTFPVYSDIDGASARNFTVTGVPETYIVDKKGQLARKVIGGFDWTSPEVRDLLKTLLAQ